MEISNCAHWVLYLDDYTEFGAQCTCIFCEEVIAVSPNDIESKYMGFESTDPPTWDNKERSIVLILREYVE